MSPYLRRLPWTTLAVITGAVAFYAVFIARTAFRVDGRLYFSLFDDGMISMRYARNLAEGHGLVWNPGDHPVEGYTNLLWTLWMAFLHLVRIPEATISLAVMISGAALLVANALVIGAITRRLSASRVVAAIAMCFTAFYYPLVYWTLRGMEVGLVTFLVSMAVLLALRLEERFSRGDLLALTGVFAAALLTRDDALVPIAVIGGYGVLVCDRSLRRRLALTLGGTIAFTLGIHTAFRIAYYGLPLPNTYYLKVTGIGLETRLYRGSVALAHLELDHLWAPTIVAGTYLLLRRQTVQRGQWLLACVFVGACAYSASVGGDAWEWMNYSNRYITPAVPGLLVLAAIGSHELLRDVRGNDGARYLVPAAFAGVFLLTLHSWLPMRLLSAPGVHTRQIPQIGALALAIGWASFPRLTGTSYSKALALFAVVLFGAVNGPPSARWAAANAYYAIGLDASETRYGLAVRSATKPDAKVAFVAVGAASYFSHRETIDLLGKNDHFIATRRPQTSVFLPGHNKWDYEHSIRELKPDVVAELFGATTASVRSIRSWGYTRLQTPRGWTPAFVRINDDLVRRSVLDGYLRRRAHE